MTIDVVVVAFRSRARLRGCVEPLCREPDIHVTVVDNDCPERSTETISDLPIRVVEMHRNAGFAAGCNAGAKDGSGEAILFLNPDARISPDEVRRLASVLTKDARCGAVGPRVVGEAGEVQLSVRRRPRLRNAFGEALFFHRLFPQAAWATEMVRSAYEESHEAEWLSGAVLLVRRSAFEELDGFDERFFMYSEDTDLCTRLRSRNLRVWYEPAATAYHEGGASAPAAHQARLKAYARLQFVRAHERGLRYAAFRLALLLNELLRLPVAGFRSCAHFSGRLSALGAVLTPRPSTGPTRVRASRPPAVRS